MGQSGFVQEHVTAVVDSVIAQISKLQGLSELPVQGRLLLLRKSLQLKTPHFMCCVESELLQEPLAKLEQSGRDMFLTLIDRQQSQVDIDHLYLPLRFEGAGLQRWIPDSGVVCKAGYLAAAALIQQALAYGPVAFQPLSGTGAAQLDSYWESVQAFLTKPGEVAVAGGFQDAVAQKQVTGLQSAVSNTATERAKQQLFSKYEDRVTASGHNTVLAEEHLARLQSLQQGVGTAWVHLNLTHSCAWAMHAILKHSQSTTAQSFRTHIL